ncbi:unnamed protein product [Chrysoparadoxa australica]
MIKLAIRCGSPILPVYCFGNTKLWGAWYDKRNILSSLSRKLGFGLLPIWGRYGLPLIYRAPLYVVSGMAIEVTQAAEPTLEQIDKVHALYLQETKRIFDKYKDAYGWGEKQLVIR